MIDKEKVIKDLEFCVNGHFKVELSLATKILNLLKEQGEQIKNRDESLEKAREEIEWLRGMLKEQEAVEPTFRQGEDGIFVWACGSCGAYMYHIYDGIDKAKEYAKYCRQCGKKVKWE